MGAGDGAAVAPAFSPPRPPAPLSAWAPWCPSAPPRPPPRASTCPPPAGALALAEATLKAIDEDLLYARIDMAPDADGRWLLMEAELIEPDFYLASAPEGGTRFAEAVRARLG